MGCFAASPGQCSLLSFGLVFGLICICQPVAGQTDSESTPSDAESAPSDVESAPSDVESAPSDVESAPSDVESDGVDNQADDNAYGIVFGAKPRSRWSLTGDFGGYFSFGGYGNTAGISARATSILQPALGLSLDYRLSQSERLVVLVGPRVAVGFNAGSARPPNDLQIRERPADFSLFRGGLGFGVGWRVAPYLTALLVGDAGIAVVSPDPFVPASDPDGGGARVGFAFGVGPAIEYRTRLSGVSIGLASRLVGTIAASQTIPGVSITVPLKYNF